ncbi:hypothetical protein BBP40_001694 [Aspergillus hancockii]|nr:hypothetical protein BBP40_001694 [Aspergillus hancockii]
MTRQKQQAGVVRNTQDAPTLSDDDIYMLAALDYRLHDLKSKDHEKDLEVVAEYLEAQCGKRLSPQEIISRLTELQVAFVPKKWKKNVFRNGTKAFSRDFPVTQRKRIEGLKNELRDENKSHVPHSERALRDTARLTKRDGPKRLRSTGASADDTNVSKKKKKVSGLNVEIAKQPGLIADCRALCLDTDDEPLTPVPPTPEAHNLLPELQLLHRGLSETLENVKKLRDTERETFSSTCRLRDKLLKSNLEVEEFVIRQHEVSALNSSLFHQRLQLEARCAESDRTIRSLNFALEENNIDSALYEQEKEIRWLKSLLEKTKRDARFARLTLGDHHRPEKSLIEDHMKLIDYKSKKVFFTYDDNHALRAPHLEDHDDLKALLCRNFGLTPDESVNLQDLELFLTRVGLQAVVCAAIAAAICDWVFASDFESTTFGDSLMLDIYRQHISRTDEGLALRNLDLAANDFLFNTRHYKDNVIPTRAATLSRRLSNALAPLVPTAPEDSPTDRDTFNTWGEEERVWQMRERYFIEIFTTALKVKCKLLTSTDRFEIVLHKFGVPFNENEMIAETTSGAGYFGSYARPVQLCLLPAVYAYSSRSSDAVQYRIPIKSDHDEESRMYLLSKAVVIPCIEERECLV